MRAQTNARSGTQRPHANDAVTERFRVGDVVGAAQRRPIEGIARHGRAGKWTMHPGLRHCGPCHATAEQRYYAPALPRLRGITTGDARLFKLTAVPPL
jgi:hypothetical protein